MSTLRRRPGRRYAWGRALAAAACGGVLGGGMGPVAGARADFSVAPTVIDIARGPGGVAVGTFSVRVSGERGQRFAIAIEDVGQDARGAFTFSAPGRSRFSASRWISLSPQRFGGAPDREQPVEFRVRIPRDAEPGHHVTSLTVKRLGHAASGSAAIVQAIAVRLTVRVAGARRPGVELRGPSAPTVAGGGPITGHVTVHNTGNVRLNFDGADAGWLAVLAGDGGSARVPFSGVLYPSQSRAFRLSWPDPPAFGRFRLKASVRTGRRQITAAHTIWVLPWRQALALLLVAFATIVLATGRGRERRAVT